MAQFDGVRVWRARLGKPPTVGSVEPYGRLQLDAVVVEASGPSAPLDFRLELGGGLAILWALPSGVNERLRLIYVDCAAFEVEEPSLVADPWSTDLGPLAWEGDLMGRGEGRTLSRVALELGMTPPRYRCELGVREVDGRTTLQELSWSAAPSG